MIPGDILPPENVYPALQAKDKKQLLKRLAAIGAGYSGLPERQVYQALVQREQACGTGVCNGIAIPHARFDELQSIVGVFARMKTPVSFDAPDGQPVDLIFLLLSPGSADTQHLKALGAVSRMMRKSKQTEALRAARGQEELYELIQKSFTDE